MRAQLASILPDFDAGAVGWENDMETHADPPTIVAGLLPARSDKGGATHQHLEIDSADKSFHNTEEHDGGDACMADIRVLPRDASTDVDGAANNTADVDVANSTADVDVGRGVEPAGSARHEGDTPPADIATGSNDTHRDEEIADMTTGSISANITSAGMISADMFSSSTISDDMFSGANAECAASSDSDSDDDGTLEQLAAQFNACITDVVAVGGLSDTDDAAHR